MLEKCYTIENNYRLFNFNMCIRYLNHLGRKKYGSDFSLNPDDRDILHKLISYAISSEEQCEHHGLDLKKGILLTGPVGCGKTSLMTLLPEFMYRFQKYPVKSTREIATEFHKDDMKSFTNTDEGKNRFVWMISAWSKMLNISEMNVIPLAKFYFNVTTCMSIMESLHTQRQISMQMN